jgi:hypothetical protein
LKARLRKARLREPRLGELWFSGSSVSMGSFETMENSEFVEALADRKL